MIDIDHFKSINDSHGHHRGDVVLLRVAECLRTPLRSRDLVYRIGGEEFLVLMPGHNLTDASHAAERLRESIAADQLAGVAVTISGGLTTATGPGIEYDAMLRAADEALYRAKANGRNQVCASTGTADPAMATSYSS
jgi:diguanylate cyclase (GGDEF)-like protein